MDKYYILLEANFDELLSLLAHVFSSPEEAQVREFIDVGEYGLALETVCGIISEEQKNVDEQVMERIRQLKDTMRFESTLVDAFLQGP